MRQLRARLGQENIDPAKIEFIKLKLNGYFRSFTDSIIPDDLDNYGDQYRNIFIQFMPTISNARQTLDLKFLPDLMAFAQADFDICNNAEYFAYNHIKTLAIIVTAMIITHNINSLGSKKALDDYLFPIYMSCKNEEAVCVRLNLAKTFILSTKLSAGRVCRFLEKRKGDPTVSFVEHGIINYVFRTYYQLLKEGRTSLDNKKALEIIERYALSTKNEDMIEL